MPIGPNISELTDDELTTLAYAIEHNTLTTANFVTAIMQEIESRNPVFDKANQRMRLKNGGLLPASLFFK